MAPAITKHWPMMQSASGRQQMKVPSATLRAGKAEESRLGVRPAAAQVAAIEATLTTLRPAGPSWV